MSRFHSKLDSSNDINKDKDLELQSKEQSPIVAKGEGDKKKSIDVFKEFIERGVKKHKRAERHHDESDFIYTKLTEKTCKELIP